MRVGLSLVMVLIGVCLSPLHQADSRRLAASINPTALRLPTTAFAPAVITPGEDRVESNADAARLFLQKNQTTGFTALGRVSGYLQLASWQTTDVKVATSYGYFASIYGTVSEAGAAWNDAVTHTRLAFRPRASTNCGPTARMSCERYLYAYASDRTIRLQLLQIGQCTAENWVIYSPDAYTKHAGTILSIQAAIDGAAQNQLRRMCTIPANFSVIAVRIEKTNSKPDWSLINPQLDNVPAGEKIRLSIYWILKSGPTNFRPYFQFGVWKSGVVIYRHGFLGKQQPYPPDSYYNHFSWKPKHPGTYTVVGSVSFSGQTQSDHTTLTVVKKVPATPAPVTFSFDSVKTYTASKKPSTTFKTNRTIVVVLQYTIRNLQGTTPIAIDRTYQYKAKTGWKPLGRPVEETFDTAGGTQTYSFSFSAPGGYSSIRVVFGITVAGQSQQKSVVLHITK